MDEKVRQNAVERITQTHDCLCAVRTSYDLIRFHRTSSHNSCYPGTFLFNAVLGHIRWAKKTPASKHFI